MALSVWEPTREALSLREAVNRLFEDSFVRPETGRNFFPMDVLENNDALVVHAALPGFNKENLEIHVENDLLTIKAESKQQTETNDQQNRYLVRERSQGSFKRSLRLPFPVSSDQAKAEFADGVLTLTLPKVEAIKPRTIKVN